MKQRSYLSQLCIGILQINTEIGRYRSIPIEARLCRLCNMNEIEDEIHFYLDVQLIMFNVIYGLHLCNEIGRIKL